MTKSKSSFLSSILRTVTGRASVEAEKARLEAFLGAFPGEYCGWARDGAVAYSQGFCSILGLSHVHTGADIQGRLLSSDSTTFESVYNRLRSDGIGFSVQVMNTDESRYLKISGSRGRDLSGRDYFDVLWIEDVTDQILAQQQYSSDKAESAAGLERFEKSVDCLLYPVWMRDAQQKITWVNRAYIDALDSTFGDIVMEQRELVPAPKTRKKNKCDDIPVGPDLAKSAFEASAVYSVKTHVVLDGKRNLMHVYEAPVIGDQGRFSGTVGWAENITAVEELDNDLKRYKATNQELLEQLRTAIGIYNVDQQLEFYNSAFAELWGLEDGWLNKKPKLGEVMEKLREERRLPEQADFRNFKKSWLNMFTSLIGAHEEMLYLPDGGALRMLAVPHSSGGLMMTFEDVTSRLELESSYNTLIAVQKETLDNLAEGVAVYGGDGRLKLWNPAFARLWGLNPEDLEGEPHISRIVEKKKPFFEEREWPAMSVDLISIALDRSMREGRLSRRDDSLMEYSAVPLPDGGVLVTFADITDTVKVERALRDKNMALEAAEKLKMDFLANVSYQLRTPLSAIMGFNDILDQEYFGPLNPRQKEYTRDIQSASSKLLDLINDILDLSTIEAGYMTLEPETVKIKPMLENLEELTTEWARKEQITVRVQCPANIGSLYADERRLKQAMINLIRNSITFTPTGGAIEISAKRRKHNGKSGIELAVSDTGIGIKRENQGRVFQPFERAQRGLTLAAEKGKAAGAGLGLSLVRNIVSLHGGELDLDSVPGQGTRVTLFFPIARGQVVESQKVQIDLGQSVE